ncbi:hypothetical protein LTR53_012388 [Teratosphaeriaceae sp. CCFEE 6253]|nr:hypothetical protein LTR53_012388 [Teratosphaeriaceae sp. CCFEE 6253]
MALVAYSDSEGSDTETPAIAPNPTTAASKAAKAASFPKTEARKIKVDLPALRPESENHDAIDEPPAKRARTAGAFGGFNSFLPAPKRAAAASATGLKRCVSLKTSAEAAFSRAVPPVVGEGPGYDGGEEAYDEFGNAPPLEAAVVPVVDEGAVSEVKVVGKATKFRPLSVGNNRKKKTGKKPVATPVEPDLDKAAQSAARPMAKEGLPPPDEAATAPKPRRSLFAVGQEDEPQLASTGDHYKALDAPEAELEPHELPQTTAPLTASAPAANSLDAIAADMNLTPSQRRQLFGRHAKNTPANIAHFDMDAEYAANEQLRQSGETVEHRAVKTLAPGKHSLQQLVNNARTNQDSIEDKWAEGRRNRGDAGIHINPTRCSKSISTPAPSTAARSSRDWTCWAVTTTSTMSISTWLASQAVIRTATDHPNSFKGEQKGEEFVKNINPNATIPAAVDGDCTITESNAILQYAADHTDHGEKAYPKDLKKRADVNRWLLWEASVWFQTCYVYLVQYVVQPLLSAEPDQKTIDAEAPQWHKLASVLDAQLGKTKYITGDHVTIADIAIASPMHLHEASKLPLDDHPNLKRWIADIEKLPSWQKTQGAVDKALLPHKQTNGGAAAQSKQPGDPEQHAVRASLNYTKALSDELTEIYFYEDVEGKHKAIHGPGDDLQEVTITDGWHRAKEFECDTHGFALHDFTSSYAGAWEDESGVRESFYPEVVDFLKKTTGAKEVLVFDHTIRTKKNVAKAITQESNTSQRAPVRLVHCDYTAESGPLRVQQLLPDTAQDLLSRRVAFYNVWKPLAKVEEMPLAMLDVTTSPPEDYFKLFLRYRERTGENYVLSHSDAHKWWYFPGMTAEQVILLKTFDSEEGRARFVGHSAFEDPETKAGAPARESVEIRTIAFF